MYLANETELLSIQLGLQHGVSAHPMLIRAHEILKKQVDDAQKSIADYKQKLELKKRHVADMMDALSCFPSRLVSNEYLEMAQDFRVLDSSSCFVGPFLLYIGVSVENITG